MQLRSLWMVLCLLLLGTAVHFIGLRNPTISVFDEGSYATYIDSYAFSHKYVFDIHPPHTKLLMATFSKLTGFEPGGSENVFAMRFFPALIGSLLPLLVFWFVRLLGAQPPTAFIAGVAICLDGLFLIQSRTLAQDGILMFWILAALISLLMLPRQRTCAALMSGFFAGMAVGTKFTGLLLMPLLSIILYEDFHRHRRWASTLPTVVIISGAAITAYLLGWCFHFWLLNLPGPGSEIHARSGKFLADLVSVHAEMFFRNTGNRYSLRGSSPWWSWPFMYKPVYIWSDGNRSLFMVGNPVVWLGTAFFFLAGCASFLRQTKPWVPVIGILCGTFFLCWPGGLPVRLTVVVLLTVSLFKLYREVSKWDAMLAIPLMAFLLSYLPYVPVQRPLFIYHYMPAFVFSLCFALLWGGKRFRLAEGKRAWITSVAILIGFILTVPVIYYMALPDSWHKILYETIPDAEWVAESIRLQQRH